MKKRLLGMCILLGAILAAIVLSYVFDAIQNLAQMAMTKVGEIISSSRKGDGYSYLSPLLEWDKGLGIIAGHILIWGICAYFVLSLYSLRRSRVKIPRTLLVGATAICAVLVGVSTIGFFTGVFAIRWMYPTQYTVTDLMPFEACAFCLAVIGISRLIRPNQFLRRATIVIVAIMVADGLMQGALGRLTHLDSILRTLLWFWVTGIKSIIFSVFLSMFFLKAAVVCSLLGWAKLALTLPSQGSAVTPSARPPTA